MRPRIGVNRLPENNVQQRTIVQSVGLYGGPVVAAAFGFGPHVGLSLDASHPEFNHMAAVVVWMAAWWLTEAVPPAVTGLLPLVLLPLLKLAPARGTGDVASVAASYGDSMIFLFLGGFLVALCIERSGLERRIALSIVGVVGDSPRQLVLGFMLATAALSMWMSNTATAMMMLPIALSVVAQARRQLDDKQMVPFAAALMLGLAYGANIGGFATLIGTPPNVVFKQIYVQQFGPQAPEISFGGWMLMAVPLSLAMVLLGWLVLTRLLFPIQGGSLLGGGNAIAEQKQQLGPLRPAEFRAGLIFLTTATLWITREPIVGIGWAPLLSLGRQADGRLLVDDSTVAMTMAVLCFVLPAEGLRGPRLLDWQTAARVPWGVLLMFGGGLALARGMTSSGLASYLGEQFGHGLQGISPLLMATSTALAMTFLTELTSNLASTSMSLPILATVAVNVGCDPRLLMIPATLSASCAFMLPVATPPNAIIYASGRVRLVDMVKAGLMMNLIGVVLVVFVVFLLGNFALGIDLQELPAWAEPAAESP